MSAEKKKRRPLTANFGTRERRTWSICNSEIDPQVPSRPRTALSRHIVNQLDKQLGVKNSITLERWVY